MNKVTALSPVKYTQTCSVPETARNVMKSASQRRRLILKGRLSVDQSAAEALEGTAYQSGELFFL